MPARQPAPDGYLERWLRSRSGYSTDYPALLPKIPGRNPARHRLRFPLNQPRTAGALAAISGFFPPTLLGTAVPPVSDLTSAFAGHMSPRPGQSSSSPFVATREPGHTGSRERTPHSLT